MVRNKNIQTEHYSKYTLYFSSNLSPLSESLYFQFHKIPFLNISFFSFWPNWSILKLKCTHYWHNFHRSILHIYEYLEKEIMKLSTHTQYEHLHIHTLLSLLFQFCRYHSTHCTHQKFFETLHTTKVVTFKKLKYFYFILLLYLLQWNSFVNLFYNGNLGFKTFFP